MTSNSPGSSGVGGGVNNSDFSSLPRGLLGRKGLPIARGARLPSIRSPRDLTLGGTPKRTFTPNLNVRRDKNKEIETDNKPVVKDGRGGRRNQRGRGTERGRGGRGRGRGRGEVIQMQGSVFGEGPAALIKKGSFWKNETENKNYIPIPKLNLPKANRTKEEKLQDEDKLQELLRDDFVDDLDGNDMNMQPIELPLLEWNMKADIDDKSLIKDEHDSKIKIKKDPDAMEVDEPNDVAFKVKKEEPLPSKGVRDVSAKELFSDSNLPESGTLLLFQFPDTLPGIAASNDDKPDARKKAGTSSQPPAEEVVPESGRLLSDFPEGYIGKLQVLKSGKTRLMLGSVAFAVDCGTPLGFLQDVVSMRAKDDGANDMIVLGHVKHKLVCMPDMDVLLTDKQT